MPTLTALRAETVIKRIKPSDKAVFMGTAGGRILVERTAGGQLSTVSHIGGSRYESHGMNVRAVCELVRIALGDEWQTN